VVGVVDKSAAGARTVRGGAHCSVCDGVGTPSIRARTARIEAIADRVRRSQSAIAWPAAPANGVVLPRGNGRIANGAEPEDAVILDYLDGATPRDLDADLCIVGAGPAGLAIAQAFAGTGVTVCIVESGGLAGEERQQALCDGQSIGSPAFDPGTSRMRVFGGSCNLWGGGCIPLAARDLQARDWVPHSGWPIAYADLEPYYAQARAFCGLGTPAFADGSFLTSPALTPLTLDARTLVHQVFARSPLLFGRAYRDSLGQARNVRVLLHANLLELEAAPSGECVRHARIGALGGRVGRIQARHYVLACGGIENARLLLLSNSVAPAGLGNDRGLVGRYFMDHPSGRIGTLHGGGAPERFARPYSRQQGRHPPAALPEICLSEQAQRRHRLLSGRVRPFAVEGPAPKGIRAMRELRAALRKPALDENAHLEQRLCAALKHSEPRPPARADGPAKLGKLALDVGLHAGDLALAVGRKLADKPVVRSDRVELVGYFEQAPNPDSRVGLGDDIDALGQRKVCVDWRLTELDRHTYRTAAALFGDGLARAGGGRFAMEPWIADDDRTPPSVGSTAHHLGTTRMSDDPRQGVVDRDCRVHGIDNLHIAGSSVFPTGGWAFPTFTIVALSLRLADTLRARMNDLAVFVS
jgi:choline dehydrogenase-like flavoprotein